MSEEQVKRGARAAAAQELAADPPEDDAGETPDFSNPSDVVAWFGRRIIFLLGLMRREKAVVRLRSLNSAIDSWSRASRLAIDSSDLEAVKADLVELVQQIENEKKTGPTGVVKN